METPLEEVKNEDDIFLNEVIEKAKIEEDERKRNFPFMYEQKYGMNLQRGISKWVLNKYRKKIA